MNQKTFHGETLRVFLVDDDEIYHLITRRVIKICAHECDILSFANGQECMDALEKGSIDTALIPDIIFLDINMPVMNGWQFLDHCGQLKATLLKQTVIYLVSTSTDELDIMRSKKYPDVKGYLVKPLLNSAFQEVLTSFCSGRQ